MGRNRHCVGGGYWHVWLPHEPSGLRCCAWCGKCYQDVSLGTCSYCHRTIWRGQIKHHRGRAIMHAVCERARQWEEGYGDERA
jgi:hypothetical protein